MTSTSQRTTAWDVYESPFGPLTLLAGPDGLTGLAFPGRATGLAEEDRDPAALAAATGQLEAYFAGERRAFDLSLDLAGTPFQQRVWAELRKIPSGETRSYAEIAAAAGNPTAVRAAGSANGANNVAVLIPCHRVIRSDGSLGGYAYGLDIKRELLERERR